MKSLVPFEFETTAVAVGHYVTVVTLANTPYEVWVYEDRNAREGEAEAHTWAQRQFAKRLNGLLSKEA